VLISETFVIAILFAASILPFIGLCKSFDWLERRRSLRIPFKGKFLRPAGHSLQKKIEELSSQMEERMYITCALPAVAYACISQSPTGIRLVVTCLVILIFSTVLGTRMIALRNERSRYRLGLAGEQLVAEHLQEIGRMGYSVFHDIQMTYGNIDHVVVGKSGVFAIEMKARRKSPNRTNQPGHEVIFDKRGLRFPDGRGDEMIKQAERGAKWLELFLAKAVGEPVQVRAILTIPGWFVRISSAPPIAIVNPKGLKSVILGERSQLHPVLVQRCEYQLDQLARDVPF
jgi:hypothetical protein